MFELHPRLAADTAPIAELALSSLRLMEDAEIPWLILVPRRLNITELHHLPAADRVELGDEMTRAAQALETLFHPDKINIGALGNLVPQLHIHVVARFRRDRAWPGPVWGAGLPQAYEPAAREARCRLIATVIGA